MHTFIANLISIKDVFFPWNYGVTYGHVLRPEVAQVNEEPPSKSFLDLTLTQHPCDEDPEPREVCAHFEVELFRV
jgi:hypothetical protein